MFDRKKVYDISVMLGRESIDFPGDPEFKQSNICDLENGDSFNLSSIQMSTHCGTHIDAPSHFLKDSKKIGDYKAEDFILNAHLIDIENQDCVVPENLRGIDVKPGDAILFKTSNSSSGICKDGVYREDYIYLSKEAAQVCVDLKAGLVGIDYVSIEQAGNRDFDTHRILLGNNILILEGLNLAEVPAGKYTLICLPLKIHNSEAAPTRAVMIEL